MNIFNNNANTNSNKGSFVDGMLYVKDLATGETRCIGSVYTRSPVAEVVALLNAVNANPDKLGLVFEDRRSNISSTSFLGQVIAQAKPVTQPQPQYIYQPVAQPQAQVVMPMAQVQPAPVVQAPIPTPAPAPATAGVPLGGQPQPQQQALQPVSPDSIPF